MKGPIFPRIKTAKFLEAAKALPGMKADDVPYTEELVGDLLLTYAVDIGEAFVSVTPGLMRSRGLDPIEVKVEAFGNMAPAMNALTVKPLGPAFQLMAENDLSACALLVSDIWRNFKEQLGASPVAIFAHRNLVFFTAENHADGIRFLQDALGQVDFDETHALSKYMYVWNQGWKTYPKAGLGEPPEDPMQAAELPVAAQFGGLDGSGRLTFPGRFKCSVCENIMNLDEGVVAGAMQARAIQARITTLKEHEAPVFKDLADRFVAMGPDCFVFDFRCPKCQSPFVVGCEGSRLASGGSRYQPLKVWEIA